MDQKPKVTYYYYGKSTVRVRMHVRVLCVGAVNVRERTCAEVCTKPPLLQNLPE